MITGKVLRHSHASYLINVLKKDILYVAKCMGHADKSTTYIAHITGCVIVTGYLLYELV